MNFKMIAGMILAFSAMFSVGYATTQSNTKVGIQQGANRMYVKSGGTLDVESGGSFKLAGTAVTTTAAQLNQLKDPDGATGGLYAKKVATFIYDVAVDGGTVATHTLAQTATLPAKAVITRSYFKIITQFSDSGSGTVALFCEDANNIKTATDITGSSANAFVEGESTGAASAFVRGIGSACDIKAVVGGVTQDTGKLIGWVEYVLEN